MLFIKISTVSAEKCWIVVGASMSPESSNVDNYSQRIWGDNGNESLSLTRNYDRIYGR